MIFTLAALTEYCLSCDIHIGPIRLSQRSEDKLAPSEGSQEVHVAGREGTAPQVFFPSFSFQLNSTPGFQTWWPTEIGGSVGEWGLPPPTISPQSHLGSHRNFSKRGRHQSGVRPLRQSPPLVYKRDGFGGWLWAAWGVQMEPGDQDAGRPPPHTPSPGD